MVTCPMNRITLIGYGNQGKAWAKNLRDSKWLVNIALRSLDEGGKSWQRAKEDGFSTIDLSKAAKLGGTIAFLIPDEHIPSVHARYFKNPDRPQTSFVFAHGFSVLYGNMHFSPKDDVLLVAPKGIGSEMRKLFLENSGVMGVLAVSQDHSNHAWDTAKKIASGLGCARVELIRSTFEEETKADLFSEQMILCGGLPHLLERSVKLLVDKGIHPRIATYECLHETKLILNMILEQGVDGMYRKVSSTARFGGLKSMETLFPEPETHARMEKLWQDIDSGKFSKELSNEISNNYPLCRKKIKRFEESEINNSL